MKRLLIILSLLSSLSFIVGLGVGGNEARGAESPDPFELASCLTEKNWIMYGRAGCSACQAEKDYFGEAFSKVIYIDCTANIENRNLCQAKGIKAYPTWEGAPAGAPQGEVQQYKGAIPLDILAGLSECTQALPSVNSSSEFLDDSETGVYYGEKKIVPELKPRQKLQIDYLKEYGAIFVAGLLSFFAPCLIPLLPTYLSIISGYTFAELYGLEFTLLRGRVFRSALFFALGFAFVFTLLGATGSIIGQLISNFMPQLLLLSGLLLIILGLMQLGIIKMPAWEFDYAWVAQRRNAKLGFISATVTGIVSALCWIPCIGPVLAGILILAADSQSVLRGITYLLVYSLGVTSPFLLASLFFPKFFDIYRERRQVLRYFSIVSGFIIIAFGLVLILDKYGDFIELYYSFVKLVPVKLPNL